MLVVLLKKQIITVAEIDTKVSNLDGKIDKNILDTATVIGLLFWEIQCLMGMVFKPI